MKTDNLVLPIKNKDTKKASYLKDIPYYFIMALHKDVIKYMKNQTDEYHKYCRGRVLLSVCGSTVIIKL